VGLALLADTAHAGPVFFAGRLEDGAFVRSEGSDDFGYHLRYSTITATVDGRTAAVKLQDTVAGPQQAVKTVCLIPLPEGAWAEGIRVSAGLPNGEHKAVSTAQYLDADQAPDVYQALAKGTDSVKVLTFVGRPAVLIPSFELEGNVELVVELQQRVRRSAGVLSLECPMPATAWAKGPVARLSLTATLHSGEPLRAIFSPTHNATVERSGPVEATVRVKADQWSGDDDFRLLWVADRDDLGLRVLAHRAEGDDDGYFMLFGNPTGSDDDRSRIDKDVLFVLDTSGSMRGEKIEQARAAMDYCLQQLNPGDRFNVITFGTEVESFRHGLVARSKPHLAAAREFVDGVVAKGRTNIGGALAEALKAPAQPGRPRIAIFLTDGTPTAGELVPEKILEGVEAANRSSTRIFVMGVGDDVNAHLLDKLAEATDGSSEYVAEDEEIDAKVATLYDRLSHPVLTDVVVSFGELSTHSVYPGKLPALFKGSEFMIFGRYRGGGTQRFAVSGTLAGEPREYVCEVDLPTGPSGTSGQFVAPLWAARKIGFLLQEIRLHGENQELIEEVVRLSKEFGIITEYTEFLAAVGTELSTDLAVREAQRQMRRANFQQAGKWAVNQARNDLMLQNRMVATEEANRYLDRRGNMVANENIRQVDGRVFYLRDGQWVDAEETGDRSTRVVKLFSDEYDQLLKANRDFARAQRLGWAVSLNVGEERIVVEKDGSQRDESLRQQQPTPDAIRQQNFVPFQNQLQQSRQNQQLNFNQIQQIPRNQRLNQQIQVNEQDFLPIQNRVPVRQQQAEPEPRDRR
jgi:Ca-activated chloride channel family protein